MSDRWIRVLKLIAYCEKVCRGVIVIKMISKIAEAIRPFVLLLVSREIIDSIINGKDYLMLLKRIIIYLTIYFVLSVITSYCAEKHKVYVEKFKRRHNMTRAVHMLDIDYGWSENEDMLNLIAEVDNLENKNVFGIIRFLQYVSELTGAVIGVAISLYFVVSIFLTDIRNSLAINGIFIVLFVSIFIIMLRVVAKITESFAKAIGDEGIKTMRYLKSYNLLIFKYSTGKDIRLFSKKIAEYYGEKYREHMERIHSILSKVLTKSNAFEILLSCISSGIIYGFVAVKTIMGDIAISEVLLYIGVFDQLVRRMTETIDALSALKSSDIYRKKLFEYYSTGIDTDNTEKPITDIKNTEKDFKFKDVSYSYPGSEALTLKNISVEIKNGQRVAIVGENGSGKTTFIKLLTGLYDNYSGDITVGEYDIRTINPDLYKGLFAPVFQDFRLLASTLRENVTIRENVRDEEIKEVLNSVGMSKFYEKHGIDVFLTKQLYETGVEISGGESQKLALARALLKGAEVFVLDEPTAALDPISEYEIYKSFDELTKGKTTIFISHRLSSCRFCNSIIVFDNGRIVQKGSHEELMSDVHGKYRQLWDSQAKYYK